MTTEKQSLVLHVDDKVEDAVAFLHEQKVEMEAELTLRAKVIGDYLIHHFFDNDLAEVSSQNPTKNVSFKKLCERTDLPFSESALRRFIHVAINFRVLPGEKARELAPSHHSVLYQVADPDERCRIACEAADGHVSVRTLRKLVKGKGRRRPGGGRKRTSEFYKEWKALVAVLENLEGEAAAAEFLEPERRDEVFRQSRTVRDRLNKLMDQLTDLSRTPTETS